MERRLAAIIAADVAAYSRLVGLDETGTFDRLMRLRAELFENGGEKVGHWSGGVIRLRSA